MFGDHQPMDLFYPEKMFQKANQDASWWDFDPRVEWLITFLRNHTDEKVLVICHQATTAIQLEQALREKEGIRSAVFHEKMTIVERDRALGLLCTTRKWCSNFAYIKYWIRGTKFPICLSFSVI